MHRSTTFGMAFALVLFCLPVLAGSPDSSIRIHENSAAALAYLKGLEG